jgi:hypothetical protein
MSEKFIDSRGGCTPVLKNLNDAIIRQCEAIECGTKTIGAPKFVLVVTNPDNLLLQEDTGELIREETGEFFTVD